MIKLPSNYPSAAQTLYEGGRKARASGEPRQDPNSATHPDNPFAWDQSYKADPTLQGYSEAGSGNYGPVWVHWFSGWDDQDVNWPARGWKYSIARGDRTPPVSFDGSHRNRLTRFRWLYTFGWIKAFDDGWARGRGNPTVDAATDGVGENEAWWEFEQGRTDRKVGNTPPIEGFKDPQAYGIPRDLPVVVTSPPVVAMTPPAQNFNSGNWFRSLLPFFLLQKFFKKKKTA